MFELRFFIQKKPKNIVKEPKKGLEITRKKNICIDKCKKSDIISP